jgi:plasmid stabilization system protein ParE
MVMQRDSVIITHKARASLKAHVDYLKTNATPQAAERVRKGVIKKCKSLKNFSGYSVERYLEDEPIEYRSVTIWDYNIIYTATPHEVRILNIIHTSMHPSSRKDV